MVEENRKGKLVDMLLDGQVGCHHDVGTLHDDVRYEPPKHLLREKASRLVDMGKVAGDDKNDGVVKSNRKRLKSGWHSPKYIK